ncbi:hypothetical protein Bequi_08295 [Brachybacterium sp. JHP9]|uniref:Roadblock/LAMTOR2 domain-containing protein n=1 Tax=Brachybacterium equifaecis TaxID=2910770 RepID=A0ABT0R3A7_9MICO|nr:hypothetical protein [Brachybacterium equifaecis]MCL6423385.1 hypothetical protein [Brachybacterium equifaecis]
MASQEDLNNLITAIANDVNGFIGASIVDVESGMPLASASRRPDFDLEVASAYNSEMVKAKQKTIAALGLNANLEDMLLTLDSQLHLIKMLSPTLFMYLAADRQSTNLALLRASVNRHTAGFEV